VATVEIEFLPQSRFVEADQGADLLQVARASRIDIESSCNGTGTCGKCLVQQTEGEVSPPHPDEIQLISREDLSQGVRLACRQKVSERAAFRVLFGSERKHRILSDGLMPKFELNPKIRKLHVQLDKPSLHDAVDDVSRLERALEIRFSERIPLAILQQLPGLLRAEEFAATVILSGQDIIGLEAGNTADLSYGIAVDIGTTTMVVSLVNLATGDELASSTMINPQKTYGLDVFTRIQHAQNAGGLEELSLKVREAIDALIGDVCLEAAVNREYVYEVAVSGNSTMMHLFLGVDPSSLGRAPYSCGFSLCVTLPARELGITIASFGEVYCLPSVSAFVGADIVAGIISTELLHKDERALFIDIGTNGEIAFSSKGKIFACSCAAGPALEGMNISCGMRAADGAIEKVVINPNVELHTIGNAPAIGLCGSGVIDAVAELLQAGVIASSGRFVTLEPGAKQPWADRLRTESGSPTFILASGTGSNSTIGITQKDVRQVQLAKGAIHSGILVLLRSLGVDLSEIDRVYLAGAFGCHVRMESMARIGLLAEELLDRVTLVGNSSKSGAIVCLLSQVKRAEAMRIVQGVEYVELSCYPDFDRLFARCLAFPNSSAEHTA